MYRIRKSTANWIKTIIIVSLIVLAVVNVSFPALVSKRSASHHYRFPSSVSSAVSTSSSSSSTSSSSSSPSSSSSSAPGEIGPQPIRSLSDISNSELLRFVLSNGTGDVSQGGRMPVQIVEPFIERMQKVEESERIRERSLKAVAKALLEEESRRRKKKKRRRRTGSGVEDHNGDDEEKNEKEEEEKEEEGVIIKDDDNNNDNDNNEKLTADSESVAKLVKDFFLDRDRKLGPNTKDANDEALVSLLVKRLEANAIVKPPPPSLSSSSSSSSSLSAPPSSLLFSSSSNHTNNGIAQNSKTQLQLQQQQQQNYKHRTNVNAKTTQNENNSDKDIDNNNDNIRTSGKERIREATTIKQQRPVQGSKDDDKTSSSNGQRSADKNHAASDSKQLSNDNVKQREPYCDEDRSALVGRMRVDMRVLKLSLLLTSNLKADVDPGGHFRPKGCVTRERIAIIIPFRDREEHLAILLHNLFPVLRRQKVDFTIFVIEEKRPAPFNRAMLFNIGFLEASKLSHFDCFIFHDVDLIPIDDRNIYECNYKRPIHFLAGVNKFKYRLPYPQLFGGVVAFTNTQYRTINGASNLFFGWGGEDDDLRNRSTNKLDGVSRKNSTVGLYDMIRHRRVSANPVRIAVLLSSVDRQDVEGLNTTKYNVTSMKQYALFTKISVNISLYQVLKTAPVDLLPEMQALKAAFSPSGELLPKVKASERPAKAQKEKKLNTPTTNTKTTTTTTKNNNKITSTSTKTKSERQSASDKDSTKITKAKDDQVVPAGG